MSDAQILIGFDGTPTAEHAIREAATLLGARRALVVTVWEAGQAFSPLNLPISGMEGAPATVDIRTGLAVDQAAYASAHQLATWGARLASEHGFDATGHAVADDVTVADTLVRLAAEVGAAAVVLGAHRHGRLSKLLLGSTSSSVIQHADCPVVVVRGE
ncbi:universal stress protein [Amycolatopsis magusensis]|uniref:universal stress protein n=1 Tax=Amycolatopsis magusensis TaxID=882444 RepID=UPI003C2F965D